MKRVTFTLCLALLVAAAAAAQALNTYTINVGDFTDVRITDDINVVYSNNPDSIGLAHFTCPKAMQGAILFSNNKKGKLTIQVATEWVENPKLPTLHIYSEKLHSVDNSGNLSVYIASLAKTDELKLTTMANGRIVAHNVEADVLDASIVTGQGVIVVDGRCRDAKYKLTGTGEIQADALAAETVYCRIAGTGSIGCDPAESLNVKGVGTGKVYYRGNPTIKLKKLGTVKVIPLDEE